MIHAFLHFLWFVFVYMTGISSQSTHYYAYWSGIATSVTVFAGGFAWVKKHNCHVVGCKAWVHTAPDPEHGWYACRKHHSLKKHYGVNPHAR